jgi:hypothetical protein
VPLLAVKTYKRKRALRGDDIDTLYSMLTPRSQISLMDLLESLRSPPVIRV